MDPLQDAIDKARSRRDGAIGQTRSPGQSQPEDSAADKKLNLEVQESRETGTPAEQEREQEGVGPPSPAQVEYTASRVVSLTPAVLADNRVIAGDHRDSRAEAYRQLRGQVLSEMARRNWNTLSITSAHENAGKTLTAVNLAISISQEMNQTVMLVDLDLRQPTVHKTLGFDVEKGLLDRVVGGEPLENILVNPSLPRLIILPGNQCEDYSSELLSSPEMKALMRDIVGRYPDRIILFDLPPLLRNDDAMVFAQYTDACLLVVEDGVTRASDLERSLQLLQSAHILGTVLNKTL